MKRVIFKLHCPEPEVKWHSLQFTFYSYFWTWMKFGFQHEAGFSLALYYSKVTPGVIQHPLSRLD